jgi:uncharacterized protein YcbK (DUF882 family)
MNPFLIDSLEELRNLVGKPIHIDSGYRSPTTNTAAGGVSHSQHLLGNAADISVEGLDTYQLYVLAEQIQRFRVGGIGIYPGEKFIHVDIRGERARWCRLDGQYKPIQDAFA